MAPRPVIPRDLAKYPDFPQRQPGQSQENYDSVIIAYWARKKKEKRKLDHPYAKLLKRVKKLQEDVGKLIAGIIWNQIKATID